MPDCQTHAIHYGAFEVLFCNHPVLASFVSCFGYGDFSGRHINIEFHVCGRRIALGDDLLALVVNTDVQSVCIPLGCVQDEPRRPWAPAIVRPVVDATSWTFSSQLMKLISRSMSRVCLIVSVVSCIDGIVVLGWVVVLLLTLLRCCNNT